MEALAGVASAAASAAVRDYAYRATGDALDYGQRQLTSAWPRVLNTFQPRPNTPASRNLLDSSPVMYRGPMGPPPSRFAAAFGRPSRALVSQFLNNAYTRRPSASRTYVKRARAVGKMSRRTPYRGTRRTAISRKRSRTSNVTRPMKTVRRGVRRMFKSAKAANKKWRRMQTMLRDTGSKTRSIRIQSVFSLNRVGAGLASPGVAPSYRGGFQSHYLVNLFGGTDFDRAFNLAWHKTDIAASLGSERIDAGVVLRRHSHRYHIRNGFSHACNVRIHLLYPKTDLDKNDLESYATDSGGKPGGDLSNALFTNGVFMPVGDTDAFPYAWPTGQSFAATNSITGVDDILSARPYLYEWSPTSDPTFQSIFRIKKARSRVLLPGEELFYSASIKNRILQKKDWSVPYALDPINDSLPIMRRGYPLILISVRGTLVHNEASVSSTMTNHQLFPTMGDFNVDIVKNVFVSAQAGPAQTYQQEKAFGFATPIQRTQGAAGTIAGPLDQWSSLPPSEEAGSA